MSTETKANRENVVDLEVALERQMEAQAEVAKLAIREYKNVIFQGICSRFPHNDKKLAVERAVNKYIQLRRRLDELRGQMKNGRLPTRAG
jgi:hypothetical protein